MRRVLQVPSLQFLAFEALGSLVLYLHPSEAALRHLEALLRASVPPALANDIARSLLQAIDEAQCGSWIRKPQFRRFTEDVVSGVLHPAITILDCSFHWSRLTSFVTTRIFKLTKLKELKIDSLDGADEAVIENGLKSLVQLESLTLVRTCTDAILTVACEYCRRLRSVDVSGSASVTDVGVTALLTLRELEHLDVFGTGVTVEGLGQLIQGLPSTLRTLGCTHAHVTLLESFPLLTSLRTGFDCIDAVKLLRILSLSLHGTPWIENMADFLGHQLQTLELHGCKGVDVGVVAHNCCALECFIMSSCSYSPRLHQTIRENMSGFRRLRHLTLDKSSKFPAYPNIDKLVLECALSSAHEIQVVRLESYAQFSKDFFERLLRTNDMRNLRELSLFAIYSEILDLPGLRFLLTRCASLIFVSLRGLPVPGMDTFHKRIKSEFPDVMILVERMDPCGF